MENNLAGVAYRGESIAGVNTCLELPPYGLVFDMGRCPDHAVSENLVFISHGHMDHVGGVVYHAAQRSLRGMTAPTYVVPASIRSSVEALFKAHEVMEGETIPRHIETLEQIESFDLGPDLVVKSFPTHHRIPSQGYVISRRRLKLLDEYKGLSGADIAKLRQGGVTVSRTVTDLEVAFTGDTTVEVFDQQPFLYQVKRLIVEVSFLDGAVPPDGAKRRGHIHLDDLVDRAHLFQNEAILFTHFSARYTRDDILKLLDAKLPKDLREKVTPLL